MADVIFADGIGVDTHEFSDGGKIIKLGINTSKFIMFMKEHVNEKGYVNIDIAESKTTGKMYAKLNTYKAE